MQQELEGAKTIHYKKDIIFSIPSRDVTLVSDIPSGDGKNDNLFYSVPSFFLAAHNLLTNSSFSHPPFSQTFLKSI